MEGGLFDNILAGGIDIGLNILDRGIDITTLVSLSTEFSTIADAQKKLDEYSRDPIGKTDILTNDTDTSVRFNRISEELKRMNTALLSIHKSGIRCSSGFLKESKEKISIYLKQFEERTYKFFDSSTTWLKSKTEKPGFVKDAAEWIGLNNPIEMATLLRQVKSDLNNVDHTLTALTDPSLPPGKISNNRVLNAILTDENNQIDPNLSNWEIFTRALLKK